MSRAGVLVVLFFAFGCSSDNPSQPQVLISEAPGRSGANAFSLELEQVFGGDENAADERRIIGNIGPVAIHESGEVFVVDRQANQIVAFGADGSVKWRKGSQGVGPGEIQYPNTLITIPDGLALVNQAGSRIDRFDLTGDYQSTRPATPGLSFKCFLPNGRFLGVKGVANEWRLQILTTQLENEADSLSLLFDATFDLDGPAGFGANLAVTACNESELLIASPGAYQIDRYTKEGTYIGSLGRSDTGWKPPSSATEQATVTVPTVLPSVPLQLGENGYLIVAQWLKDPDSARDIANAMVQGIRPPLREWVYSLDLFDEKGALVSTLSGEGESPIGRPIASDKNGAVYTYIDTPFPQIRRYSVVFN